ncbi:FUSC family protein [Streptomyces sp. NPDC002537]
MVSIPTVPGIPWGRTARGGLVLVAGLTSAVSLAHPVGAILVVLGALCTINADIGGISAQQLARLTGVIAGGSAGVLLGCLAARSAAEQTAAMALAGLVAGLLGGWGPGGSLAGLKLMILTTTGMGLAGSLPLTHAIPLYLLGCTPMALWLATATLWRREALSRKLLVSLRTGLRTLADVRRWTDGLRLALCVALAAAVAALLHPGHAAWLPLTTALVFRLEDDSVVARVLHRAAGTAVGVLVVAGLVHYREDWTMTALALVVGAVLPGATDKAYALHTALVSVIMLILAHPDTPTGEPDITARLTDTAVGCAIALLFGCILWPSKRCPGKRRSSDTPAQKLAEAEATPRDPPAETRPLPANDTAALHGTTTPDTSPPHPTTSPPRWEKEARCAPRSS